jgi:hypothetical protein
VVDPVVTPDTIPEVPTVATEVVLLAHVPPVGVPVNVIKEPLHTHENPVIAVGIGFTVTSAVT